MLQKLKQKFLASALAVADTEGTTSTPAAGCCCSLPPATAKTKQRYSFLRCPTQHCACSYFRFHAAKNLNKTLSREAGAGIGELAWTYAGPRRSSYPSRGSSLRAFSPRAACEQQQPGRRAHPTRADSVSPVAETIASDLWSFAAHAGRKTVQVDDVALAGGREISPCCVSPRSLAYLRHRVTSDGGRILTVSLHQTLPLSFALAQPGGSPRWRARSALRFLPPKGAPGGSGKHLERRRLTVQRRAPPSLPSVPAVARLSGPAPSAQIAEPTRLRTSARNARDPAR